MAKTLYFDCFSGASGDMVLGALLDLGLPIDGLRAALGSLAIEYGGVAADRVLRAGVSATKFRALAEEPGQEDAAHSHSPSHDHEHTAPDAHSHPHDPAAAHQHPHSHTHAHSHAHGSEGGLDAGTHEHPHTHQVGAAGHHHAHHSLKEIGGYIDRSALSAAGKQQARQLFERLAEAEAAIHAMPVERVHLHEVGALDSIIDIVGAVYGLEWLGADRVLSSPLNVGSGVVVCAHGTFPVPAPATARILRGAPIYAGEVQAELVTPTGALIVTGYATAFGPLPPMRLDAIGYGAGSRDFKGHPNVLRLLVGDDGGGGAERIVTLECEIDDMNPQLFGPLMDRLNEAGALDVFYAAVQMKKNRPGTLVTVLARPDDRERLAGVMFAHTTTIGIRYQEMLRDRLDREIVTVETPLGAIRFKVARRGGRVVNAAPEFDDCVRVGAEQRLPIKDVQAVAIKAWLER